MSTAGGAAGLTLTAATTAILLEPSLNPGLEAQAAARIWRLGACRRGAHHAREACTQHAAPRQPAAAHSVPAQPYCHTQSVPTRCCHRACPSPAGQDKPTRVVRFLAKNTVEAQVGLAVRGQQHRWSPHQQRLC